MPTFLTAYWGKARPATGSGASWHPLAYHSLDVAAAMVALLETRPAWLAAIAAAGGLSREETRLRLMLAAALHDLGKFAENFQQKAPQVYGVLQPNAFAANDRRGHGEIGAGLLDGWLGDARLQVIRTWIGAAFAHHGAPVESPDSIANAMSPQARVNCV